MKLQFKCAVCGNFLGEYIGESFFVIPAVPTTHIVCKKCVKKPPYAKAWPKDKDKKHQTIIDISEPETKL